MSAARMPGMSQAALLDALESGPKTQRELSALVGISEMNVGRNLKKLEVEGLVSRRQENNRWLWSLTESAAAESVPTRDDVEHVAADSRVALVKELLEIETMLTEAIARRAEILAALA